MYSEDAAAACADALYVLCMREATVWDREEIDFFNVIFQHFKFYMYDTLCFEGIVVLKLLKRVGSKAVSETLQEFAAKC